ncbi:nitroreductase family protein [Desulfovibrio sp. OttesenSCG-928-G15]|nr:nitroreductase family protein [Desulfovibrio sp. OttesenSCG-928-G15]
MQTRCACFGFTHGEQVMDIFTTLHTRRSIRSYDEGEVSREELHALLDAAMIAPSAGNARPWQFVVITDKDILGKIPAINQYAAMAAKAPLGITVCGDTRLEKYSGFWVQDCSAAVQNMLLAATALGLGAVWTGIHPIRERVAAFQSLLSLPPTVIPLAHIVIGRHCAKTEEKHRFEEAKVHYNAYREKD